MSPRNATYRTTENELIRVLGQRIRTARSAAGYSLKELEAMTDGGFKASIVGAYERGERHITAARLVSLAFLLETSAADLLCTP